MANNCSYQIVVIGDKENCESWLRKMNCYDEENHFHRIFSAEVCDKEYLPNGKYRILISGDCAWSLETCCRTSGYPKKDLFEINTRDLSLVMEAYSEEVGMEFAEHYIYDKGKCVVEECIYFSECLWDKYKFGTYEEFKKDYVQNYGENPPDENEFDEDGVCRIGGYDWVDTIRG